MTIPYDTYSTRYVHTVCPHDVVVAHLKVVRQWLVEANYRGAGRHQRWAYSVRLHSLCNYIFLAGYGKMWYIFPTIEGQALDPPPAAAKGRPERDEWRAFRGTTGDVQKGQGGAYPPVE